MVAVLSSVAGRITLCQNPAGGVVVRYRGILSGERYIFLHLASKLPGSRQVCLLRTGLAEAAHPQGSNVAADRLQKAATPGVGKRDRQQWDYYCRWLAALLPLACPWLITVCSCKWSFTLHLPRKQAGTEREQIAKLPSRRFFLLIFKALTRHLPAHDAEQAVSKCTLNKLVN